MKLRWIDPTGMSSRDLAELPALLQRTDGFLWLDIPEWSDDAEAVLTREFHFHPMAVCDEVPADIGRRKIPVGKAGLSRHGQMSFVCRIGRAWMSSLPDLPCSARTG